MGLKVGANFRGVEKEHVWCIVYIFSVIGQIY